MKKALNIWNCTWILLIASNRPSRAGVSPGTGMFEDTKRRAANDDFSTLTAAAEAFVVEAASWRPLSFAPCDVDVDGARLTEGGFEGALEDLKSLSLRGDMK
jgi:hypothetical protein